MRSEVPARARQHPALLPTLRSDFSSAVRGRAWITLNRNLARAVNLTGNAHSVEIGSQTPRKSLGLLGSAPARGFSGCGRAWSPEHCREVHAQGWETEFRIQLARMRFCLPVPRNHSRPLPQLALSRARGAPRAAPVAVCAGEEGLAVRDGTVSFAIELAPKLRADTRARTSWAAPLARAGRRARRGGGGEESAGYTTAPAF
jgi:hypothetical protein